MSIFSNIYFYFGLTIFSLLVVSIGFTMSADKSIDFSVREATKQAMHVGINKGCLRVYENISLDEKVTKETLIRSFAEISNFDEGTADLYVHEFSSYPPMLSTEVYHTIDTPFKTWLNVWDRGDRNRDTTVRELEVAIFEAKSASKPNGSKVPGQQCGG